MVHPLGAAVGRRGGAARPARSGWRDPASGAGAQRARAGPGAAHGVREVAVFASATETFARKNLNRTVAESLGMIGPVVTGAVAAA